MTSSWRMKLLKLNFQIQLIRLPQTEILKSYFYLTLAQDQFM